MKNKNLPLYETAFILIGEIIVSLIVCGVYLIIGKFSYKVITGVTLGTAVTVLNFLFLAISYNYYDDCAKTSLVGGGTNDMQDYITYHHNWFNGTDQRTPRARNAHIHMYNNYFSNVTGYCVGASHNSMIFTEANYFENSKSPLYADSIGSDPYSGCIKSYEDYFTPTEFELITAIALCYFAKHNCDYVVFEVGMGGRLDSTNIIGADTVAASVITGIAMDHTAFLGDTPEKIAAEKAGIIKAGVPVIFGGNHAPVGAPESEPPSPEAAACARVIREKAAEASAPYVETDHTKLGNIRTHLFGADFDFGTQKDLHVSLAGLYQPFNAATVLTVLDVLRNRGLIIPEEAVREGLASVTWPARFEVLSKSPLIIADGGHNPEGIDAAIASVKAYFKDEKILLLTGVMADKDYTHMVARMGEVAFRAFCVRPANDRALDPAKYAEAFSTIGIPAEGYATVADGVIAAAEAAKREGKALLCLGSLYMYGEVREAVLNGVTV